MAKQPDIQERDQTGRVKWFNAEKAYGFIARDTGEDDCFVHGDSVVDGNALRQGDKVLFDVALGSKGPKAVEVRISR